MERERGYNVGDVSKARGIPSPVNVLWIARYDYEPEWRVLPHAHDFFQIVCTIDGRGTATLGEEEIPLEENVVVLVPPRVTHLFSADCSRPLKTLDTKFEVFDRDLAAVLGRVTSPIGDKTHVVRHLLERIRTEGMQRLAWHRHLCNALLLQCVLWLIGDTIREPAITLPESVVNDHDSVVCLAKNFIEVHYAENIDSRTIAAGHVGYSPEYLSKRFSQATGLSLHAYLMRLRTAKAKEMLTYEELSIKEVAFLVGFKTIHHFSRAFKDIEGVPPARWRDRERAGVRQNIVISPGFENTDLTITKDGQAATEVRT